MKIKLILCAYLLITIVGCSGFDAKQETTAIAACEELGLKFGSIPALSPDIKKCSSPWASEYIYCGDSKGHASSCIR